MVTKFVKCKTCLGTGVCDDDTTCTTCAGTGEMPASAVPVVEPCFNFTNISEEPELA
jgi:DnaJ-class molecular chaperone